MPSQTPEVTPQVPEAFVEGHVQSLAAHHPPETPPPPRDKSLLTGEWRSRSLTGQIRYWSRQRLSSCDQTRPAPARKSNKAWGSPSASRTQGFGKEQVPTPGGL